MTAAEDAALPEDLERVLERAEAAYSQHRQMCMRTPSYCWRCRDLRADRSAAWAALAKATGGTP